MARIFITEIPHMAIRGGVFDFPGSGPGGADIRLIIDCYEESRTYDGLRAAMQGMWPADAFNAVLELIRKRQETVATWLVSGMPTMPTSDSVNDVFWVDCLSVLDEVSLAYRIVTGVGIGETSKAHVVSPVVYLLLDEQGPTDRSGFFLRPDERWAESLGPSDLEQMTAVVVARYLGEPMFEWRRWLERAKDDRRHGFNGPAVVEIQTAVEVFFADLRSMLLLDIQSWQTQPTVQPLNNSFKSLVQSVGQLIGTGQWDVTATTPLGQYWTDLYLLRNRVIHASHRPSDAETEAAFRAHDAMRDWLRDILLQHPRKFPRTLMAFPGANWILNNGRVTNFLRTQIDFYNEPDHHYWTDDPVPP